MTQTLEITLSDDPIAKEAALIGMRERIIETIAELLPSEGDLLGGVSVHIDTRWVHPSPYELLLTGMLWLRATIVIESVPTLKVSDELRQHFEDDQAARKVIMSRCLETMRAMGLGLEGAILGDEEE